MKEQDKIKRLVDAESKRLVTKIFKFSLMVLEDIRQEHLHAIHKLKDDNLTEKQINYAAQDTQYLFEIKNKLIEMLEREKRFEIFEKCMNVVPTLVDMEISGFKTTIFEH